MASPQGRRQPLPLVQIARPGGYEGRKELKMEFYKVYRYYNATGAFYDTVIVKSFLDVIGTTEQLEKKNSDFIYRLERINIPTVDIYGVHC